MICWKTLKIEPRPSWKTSKSFPRGAVGFPFIYQGVFEKRVAKYNQHGTKMDPKWSQKPPKSRPGAHGPMGYPPLPGPLESKNNIDPTKRREVYNPAAPLFPKKWPTWPQVGSQVGAKMDKKSTQKSIKKLIPPKIGFSRDFGGFWEGKWSQVGTKIDQKSMPRYLPKLTSFFDRCLKRC